MAHHSLIGCIPIQNLRQFWKRVGNACLPCGWLPTEQEVLKYARLSQCTQSPGGIKGADVAHCVYLARTENNKDLIINTVQDLYSYDLSQTYEEIRATNTFNETCQVTVPQAIVCFLESHDLKVQFVSRFNRRR